MVESSNPVWNPQPVFILEVENGKEEFGDFSQSESNSFPIRCRQEFISRGIRNSNACAYVVDFLEIHENREMALSHLWVTSQFHWQTEHLFQPQ